MKTLKIAKCGHIWFHKHCEVCKEIERICEEEFKKSKLKSLCLGED